MFKIALTGGIASGKSTVAALFAKHGIDVIDTDVIARELVAPNRPAWQEIVAHFGETIVLANQELDRRELRQKVFSSATEKQWLETLLHPLIRQKMLLDIQQATSPYCIVVIPLLTATSHENMFDHILVVDLPEALQQERLIAREQCSPLEANNMINAQIPRDERLKFANDVIQNIHNHHELAITVDKLHQIYLRLADSGNHCVATDTPLE
jgi:dephospho-CoA kinase